MEKLNLLNHKKKKGGQSKVDFKEIQDIFNRYLAGESTRKIALNSKIGKSAILTLLVKNSIERKTTGNGYKLRKYSLDEKYFDSINSERKAYWLGFILADGHVSDDGVIIRLKATDDSHLSKLITDLESDTTIKYVKSSNSCVVCFYSTYLVKALRKLGLSSDKSKTAFLPGVAFDLQKHLIRGVIDGDGSVSRSKNKYLKGKFPNYGLSICGTESVVASVREIIDTELKFSTTKTDFRGNNFAVYYWGGNLKCLSALNWLYSDATIYLNRKYERYLQLKLLYI